MYINIYNRMENIKVKAQIKHILADGTEKIYTYDQKKYNDKYYNKNKERLNKSIECPLCKGTYCPNSLSKHTKSKRHLKFERSIEDENKENKN